MDTLVVGAGHVGTALLEHLKDLGRPARGMTRDPDKAAALRRRGLDVVPGNAADLETYPGRVPEGGAVVYTAPPVPSAAQRDLGARVMREAIVQARPRVVVYLSTTGVYAEKDGGVVSEESPVDEESARAALRLDAERVLLAAAREVGGVGIVFRLAGIYGRGRGLAGRLREGRVRLWGGGHNVLNRIHVDDIVRFVTAALDAGPEQAGIYNLADEHPAPLREYAFWLADRLGVPPPPEAPLSEAPSPTLVGSKRVSSLKARRAFGLALRYPSYVEGNAPDAP